MLIDLIQEVKEKGYKLRICPPVDTNLVCFFFIFFWTQYRNIIYCMLVLLITLNVLFYVSEPTDGNITQSRTPDCRHVSLPSEHERTWQRPTQSQTPLQPALSKVGCFSSALYHQILHGLSLNRLTVPLACCATVVSVLHLSFTCFLSLSLWWPLLPADTGSTWSQLNESSTYTKHSQREWTSLNGWFFFSSVPPVPFFIPDQCLAGWTIVVFTFL